MPTDHKRWDGTQWVRLNDIAGVAGGMRGPVYIGGDLTITGRMRINSTGDVSGAASTGHPFQIGLDSGVNVTMDGNEFQGRNNGVIAGWSINPFGGLLTIGLGGCTVNGPLTATGAATFTGATHVSEPVGMPLKVTGGASTGGYIGFYESTTRRGYCGHYPDGSMSLAADSGHVYLRAVAATGNILFMTSNADRGRVDEGGNWNFNKTDSTLTTAGCMIAAGDYVAATGTTLNTPLLVGNKIGAGAAAGCDFFHARWNNTTRGSITGTAGGVAFNTTSDYRQKDIQGPIIDGLERVRALKPYRVIWKDDPDQAVVDAFIAHEVAEVVPEAVTGEKDAVADEDDEGAGRVVGEIIPQQLDRSHLIPILTAAVQELADRVEALEMA